MVYLVFNIPPSSLEIAYLRTGFTGMKDYTAQIHNIYIYI